MKKLLGLLAVAGLMIIASPAEHAQALGLSSPIAAPTAQHASGAITTEVRWHGHPRWHRHHHMRRHHHHHRGHRHHRR